MKTSTPEALTANPSKIPAWARGTEARLVAESTDCTVDAWDLYRDGALVGCMYDEGSGYSYDEGHGISAGDWTDSDMPWA